MESPVLDIPFSFQSTQQPFHSQEKTGSKGNLLQERALRGVLRQTYHVATGIPGVSQMEAATMGEHEGHHVIFTREEYVHLAAL